MPAFDGSKDYRVNEKLYSLVFEGINDFRQELQSSLLPKSLKDLSMMITPPKGVSQKALADEVLLPGEGTELFNCEGEEIKVEVEACDVNDEDVNMTEEK